VVVAAIDRKGFVVADEQARENRPEELEDLELEEVDAESVTGGGGGVPGGPRESAVDRALPG
jgi:hypothetical protein